MKSGRVRLTVWENKDSQGRKYFSINLVRLYKRQGEKMVEARFLEGWRS